jgi:TonB family protein
MTEDMNSLLEERGKINRRHRPAALIFSVAVHLGALLWIFFPNLGAAAPREVVSAPGFVHVRMVSGPAVTQTAEPEAAVAALPPAPEPEPVSEPAPRLVETIPDKAPAKKPKKKPAPQVPAPRPATVKTAAGNTNAAVSGSVGLGSGPGQGGLVGTDGLDTRFSWYLDLVVSRISAVWQEPYLDSRFGKTYKVTVYFIILRNGSVSDVRVEETSGVEILDLSAIRSIREAAPLPPLPQDFRGDHLGVHFWFEYERD